MSKNDKLLFIDKVVDTLYLYCPQMMDEVAYFVGCQFALESNFGQSRLAKTKNNFCGMCLPKSRMSLNIAVSGDFAEFHSFDDCVLDYCFWLAWNKFNYLMLFNIDLYTRHLVASKYCPETDYIDRIYTLFNQLKPSYHGERK